MPCASQHRRLQFPSITMPWIPFCFVSPTLASTSEAGVISVIPWDWSIVFVLRSHVHGWRHAPCRVWLFFGVLHVFPFHCVVSVWCVVISEPGEFRVVHAPHDCVLGHRLGVLAGGPIAAAQELRLGGAVCHWGSGVVRTPGSSWPRFSCCAGSIFSLVGGPVHDVSAGPELGFPDGPALELVVLVSEAWCQRFFRVIADLPVLGSAAGRLADDRVGGAVFTVGGPRCLVLRLSKLSLYTMPVTPALRTPGDGPA